MMDHDILTQEEIDRVCSELAAMVIPFADSAYHVCLDTGVINQSTGQAYTIPEIKASVHPLIASGRTGLFAHKCYWIKSGPFRVELYHSLGKLSGELVVEAINWSTDGGEIRDALVKAANEKESVAQFGDAELIGRLRAKVKGGYANG